MGMKSLFSDDAKFPNLLDQPGPLKVSKIIHKAIIEVDEYGVEGILDLLKILN